MLLHAFYLPENRSKRRSGDPTARRKTSNNSLTGGHGSEMPALEQKQSCPESGNRFAPQLADLGQVTASFQMPVSPAINRGKEASALISLLL